jgi:dihydroflavonol-4-reductase
MILVTGGAGLLGRELIQQLLAKGEMVKAIYNRTSIDISHKNLTTPACDILDVVELEAVLKNVTHVYHCAGLVSFAPSDIDKLISINVNGTANIVNACLTANVQKLIHVSSVAALGRLRPEQEINETMQWTEETSNSKYGQSKYLGEMEVWRGVAEGLKANVVCPSIILGCGNWEDGSSKLFKTAYDNFNWYSNGITGFVNVADVAKTMIMLMEANIENERFIVSAENKSYKDVLHTIAKYFNKKPASKEVTPFWAGIAWRAAAVQSLFTGTKPLITKETAHTSLTKVYFNNNKLLQALPAFSYRKIEESIQHICEAFQKKYLLSINK